MSDLVQPLSGVVHARSRKPMVGYVLYIVAAALFAVGDIAAKMILVSGMEPSRFSQIRLTGSFLTLAVFVAVTNVSAFRLRRSEIPALMIFGIIGFSMTQASSYVAYQRMPVGVTLLIVATAPIMVSLWFHFRLSEPTRGAVWFALLFALIGLGMVARIWLGVTLDAVGVGAAFLSALCTAIYFVLGDVQVRGTYPRDAVSLTMWGFAAGALFWVFAAPWWQFPWSTLRGSVHFADADQQGVLIWVLVVCVVVLATVVPYCLVVASLKHIRGSQASAVGLTELPVAFLFAWVALGETLEPVQIAGALIVLIGVFVAELVR